MKARRAYTTVLGILATVHPFKPMTMPTVYKHLRALRIRPLGKVRQCPQLYPADSAARILERLGINP